MKKISTVVAKQSKNVAEQKLTVGLDLGDRSSWYCVLNEVGEVLLGTKAGHDSESDERSVLGCGADVRLAESVSSPACSL